MVLKMTVSPDLIGGDVDAGYGKVADAFRATLRGGAEVGAAVAVYRDGAKVVDLWGGYRNGLTKDPWRPDTMVNMFSTTKGVAALVVAVAVSRGLISYDAKVADYWPEFAQSGKADVTVRQLLGHQAGLCALKPKPTLADVADPERLSPILAAQTPAWRPGTRHGYHAITLGWYESELIRHSDPAGRTLGRFLADEIVTPSGLDLHIGLPDSVDRTRVAHVHNWVRAETLLHLGVMPPGFVGASLNPVGLTARTSGSHGGQRVQRRLQPRRRPGGRDPVGQRHRNRQIGGARVRQRRRRRRRGGAERRHARVPGGAGDLAESGRARQGDARRRGVFARLL